MAVITIFNICVTIIAVIAQCYILFRVFAYMQGDENIVFNTAKCSEFNVKDISFDSIHLVARMPFKNIGKQNGTIIDCFSRAQLPQEQFNSVEVKTWVHDVKKERHDNYWEAAIFEKNQGSLIDIHIVLQSKSGNIRQDAQHFPHMHIDILAQIVGRSDWHITKSRITLKPEEVERALVL